MSNDEDDPFKITPSAEPDLVLEEPELADPFAFEQPEAPSDLESAVTLEEPLQPLEQQEIPELPQEFETPGVAAVLESASPAFTLSEELMPATTIEESFAPNAPSENTGELSAASPAPTAEPTPPETELAPAAAIENVRQYADSVGLAEVKASVPAAFPFSLLIEGRIGDVEREKLMDLFSNTDLGIREIDLEPQLASGRILIPRISEYAGVLLVQALRSLPLRMRLGPAEEIYSKASSLDEDTTPLIRPDTVAVSRSSDSAPHPADLLPMTSEDTLPQFSTQLLEVLDTITVSATLKSSIVEANDLSELREEEFQKILENLQREIRVRAYRKGASGIVRFKTELIPLNVATHYRLMATGVAVRPEHLDPFTNTEFTAPEDPLLGEPGTG
ncbi:MAG: hypothetical protein P4M08_09510 [Oligoflexia bacterium]|nr:hypothetical protein [Oligoflexia bacterium]